MGTSKPASSQGRSIKTKREKRDVDVMNTNDSSITSKRSVSKLYFSDEPDWYEAFVPKYLRRNPLINRGYWLRMHAIEQVTRCFLEKETAKKKVVVNLGCGYDPLPFQFWHRYPHLTHDATFIDVDYPQLIECKRDRMLANDLLRDGLIRTKLLLSSPPIYLRSDRYLAVGCDLRDLCLLEQIFQTEFDATALTILFIAEVSLTYMPVTDASKLIHWTSTFEDARFAMLEQYLPQGPGHPFAQTMLSHFDKLHTPIKAVNRYQSLAQQTSRFHSAGWTTVESACSLWNLWLDPSFTPLRLRQALNSVEPFDEWEEFALFAGHYFLLVASNADPKGSVETTVKEPANSTSNFRHVDPNQIVIRSERHYEGVTLTPRRFFAAFALSQDSVVLHAGQGTRERLSTLDVLSREDYRPTITLPPRDACMCHTITSIGSTAALLVGGRTSPMQALADTWFFENEAWTRVADLPKARYRHCATVVPLNCQGSQAAGVLVFGGKMSDGSALCDWVLWTINDGWQAIPIEGSSPSARFGAAMATMGADAGEVSRSWGLVMGGMSADGTILDDVWEWSISSAPTLRLTFTERTSDVRNKPSCTMYARVGASLVPWGSSVLLIGGVSRGQLHSLSEDFLLISPSHEEIVCNNIIVQTDSTWPLLVGMTAVAVSSDEILVMGGGAVCFSMGSFWNKDYIRISRNLEQGRPPWRTVPQVSCGTAQGGSTKANRQMKRKQSRVPSIAETPRVQLESHNQLNDILAASRPVIMEGLDIGPCIDLWTLDYIKEKLGPERELVIHQSSSDRMTFKDKNFQYIRMPAGDFLDGIALGKHAYLRAVSSSQPNKLPTKIEEDFPAIAQDFRLPDVFESVKSRSHSSPLRISGPVSLWLHYDVLANILCQIRGTKRLRLYAPSDVRHLHFPPGASSSNMDVLTSQHTQLQKTHPQEARLKPGDILFIPPAWSHTASPEQNVSIAVNVFWRDLDKGYAAGRDVYGNRDLQAYENGRRDVERMIRSFKDVPLDLARFYLERLAGEIQDQADALGKKKQADEGKDIRSCEKSEQAHTSTDENGALV